MSEDAHYTLLRTIEQNLGMSQRDLARELGISLGKTNYCLKAMVAKGLVKVENFRRNNNKLAYSYLLTPSGMAHKVEMMRRFLQRKQAEYEALKSEIAQLEQEARQVQAGANGEPLE